MDCRSILLLSVLLLSPLVASGLEFTTFLGKTADPCHRYLSWSANGLGGAPGTAVPLNCAQNSAVAPRSNTVLWGVNGPLTLPLAAGTLLTINGIGLPKGATLQFVPVTTDTCPTGAVSTADGALGFTGTVNAAGTAVTFQPPTTWAATARIVENAPRRLCWAQAAAGPWVFTGFKLGWVWNCVNNNDCNGDARRSALAGVTTLTPLDRTLKSLETTCCTVATGAATATGRVQGQCVNPNVQGCCGSTAFELAQSRCCSATLETTAYVGAPCPCTKDADCPALDALSPNPTFCCLPTKYTQTNNPTSGAEGQCVRSKEEGCCDTGSLYDLGSEQCCPISGVQSLNKPCPCSQDAHCQGRVFTTTAAGASTSGWTDVNQRCCTQTAPNTGLSTATCDVNAFFPTGTGAPEVAPCPGTCFDVTYSICCNGVQCMKNYEVCCNSTCCNRFSGTCLEGFRGGATGRSVNPRDYGLRFQQCSTVEFLSTVKAFWVFVFPAGLLAASLAALALCMVFASKATPRSLSLLEHVMIGAAILTIFLAMPLYFAPVYKYGIWIIFVMMVANLSAAARIKWLNIVTIIVLFITVIYVFDPFFGNAWLTLASNRVRTPAPPAAALYAETDLGTSGLLHSIALSWRSLADQSTNTMNYCVEHYDWFLLDPQLRDVRRYDNPQIRTFGYCSRGWTTALIFFSFCVMSLILLQLVLFVLGLFVRFHHDKIELEVHEELAY